MKRHQITSSDITAWVREYWVQFAASAGEGSNKTLEMTLDGLYRVTDHGKVLYIGRVRDSAISEYNAAP